MFSLAAVRCGHKSQWLIFAALPVWYFTFIHCWKNIVMWSQHVFFPRKILVLTVYLFSANKGLKQDKSKPNSWPILTVFTFSIFLLRQAWRFFFPHGLDLTHRFYYTIYSKKFFTFPQQWRKQAVVRLMREQNWNTDTRKSSLSIPLLTRNFTVACRQLEKEETHTGVAKISSSFLVQTVYFSTVLFHKKRRLITFLLRYNTG